MTTTFQESGVKTSIQEYDMGSFGLETVIEITKAGEKMIFHGQDVISLLNCFQEINNFIQTKRDHFEKITGGDYE